MFNVPFEPFNDIAWRRSDASLDRFIFCIFILDSDMFSECVLCAPVCKRNWECSRDAEAEQPSNEVKFLATPFEVDVQLMTETLYTIL